MEPLRTAVDNAPLLVNLLRLIRDARSPNYKDHEKGPVTFHFGGLSMRDSGNYEEAEELWRQCSWRSGALAPNAAAPFRGPLHLVVYLNHSPVEVWTLQDYREPATDHSVPRDFEQLEALNTLVRVLFAHLRCQDIYGVVLQSCVTATDDANSSNFPSSPERHVESLPSSPLPLSASWSRARTPHSPANHVSLRLFRSSDECPTIPAHARRQYLWSSDDFVRVDVTMDRAWRHRSWIQPTPQASSSMPMPATDDRDQDTAVRVAGKRSSPIRTGSPRLRRFGSDAEARSQSITPEVMGSLGKSSLPTPYLAPTATLAPSSHHSRSPGTTLSPLIPGARLSPGQGVSEFALPSVEQSDLLDGDRSRQSRRSRSSPPMTHSSIFASNYPGGSGGAAHMATLGAVNQLEDAVLLSNAEHVRRMGTLVCSRKQSPSTSSSPSLGKKPRSSLSQQRPEMGSLVPSISMGALSGVDIDKRFLSSEVDLEDLGTEAALPESSESVSSSAATEHLMSLLGLCSKVKLQHVQPAPFGDLVLSLNLREVP
ncbi:hypothetical protein LSCM1_03829 [Leishmania martiniquensis]|uniref:Uncharacterized protein n=1 Tax=Leishmania martiniquensis TaxID=1580590 RepID=A0A836KJ09_9TRYP|nr:hypothetical protein LSCM1_03829 [Leishmania martiniquensis]